MRTMLAILFLAWSAAACDSLQTWEASVAQAENPEAHARDMFTEWMAAHRCQIEALHAPTLAKGQAIMEWMDSHGYEASAKVCALYKAISDRVQAAAAADMARQAAAVAHTRPPQPPPAEIVAAPPKPCAAGQ